MTLYIMDNFLGEKECEQLLKDASKLPDENYINSHENKRKVLASSSYEFKKLIASSDNWQKLDKKINSKDFFDNIKKKLSISKSFYLTSFFSNYSTSSKNHLSFKNLGLYQLRNVNLVSLIKYIIYKSLRFFHRIIKFNLINLIKAQPVELLYDYSKAVGGYKNRVHRDTDNRILIILIYLNFKRTSF